MGISRVNLVVNFNPCLEKPALTHSTATNGEPTTLAGVDGCKSTLPNHRKKTECKLTFGKDRKVIFSSNIRR